MIEFLCTLTGIIAGVAVVASLLHQQGNRQQFEAKVSENGPDRIRGIADQLQVISHRVAADVSAHSEKVEHFSGRLARPAEQPEEILSTINEIITANQAMQGQLADAQKRIAQQSQMIEQASQQARTDALTGLANRRALDEFVANCLGNLRDCESVGLLLMDIDHFKNFNDSFGHTTGDAVLASFARSISTCCGDGCYAARFGGEEFAVILSAPTPTVLARQAAAIRYYISQQVISYEDLQLTITSSAGLCVLLPGDTANSAYERADEGLYQSKKAGRNCGHWISEVGWQPFPEFTGEAKILADFELEAEDFETRPTASVLASSANAVAEERSVEPADHARTIATKSEEREGKPTASSATASADMTEILDLPTFLNRLESYLEQLRKADLPATAIMVEAIGLLNADRSQAIRSWDEVVGQVQQNLRGIDIVCLYRPFTLCIFMPGSSIDAGIDRAARVQAKLRDARDYWAAAVCPERFSVSVAGVNAQEDSIGFLNRLESALDEAVDASDSELVVHTGEACHFQAI